MPEMVAGPEIAAESETAVRPETAAEMERAGMRTPSPGWGNRCAARFGWKSDAIL